MNSCPKCGGNMVGDGYTLVLHCEFVEDISDATPDDNPILCNYTDHSHTYQEVTEHETI